MLKTRTIQGLLCHKLGGRVKNYFSSWIGSYSGGTSGGVTKIAMGYMWGTKRNTHMWKI